MKRFDQSSAICQVFTYKEGLLSTVSYDLRINVTSFVVDLDEKEHFVKARVAADSLRVDCAMVDGEEKPGVLNSWEKDEIERIMIRDVLDARRFKELLLTSSSITKDDSTYFVRAVLALHGTEREIAFTAKNGGEY
jgi:polyisoprenoid-binding protein YceI